MNIFQLSFSFQNFFALYGRAFISYQHGQYYASIQNLLLAEYLNWRVVPHYIESDFGLLIENVEEAMAQQSKSAQPELVQEPASAPQPAMTPKPDEASSTLSEPEAESVVETIEILESPERKTDKLPPNPVMVLVPTCAQCEAMFRDSTSLQAHIDDVHTKKVHKCKFCSKGFPSKHVLLSHEKSHEEDFYLHHCTLCTKRYKTSGGFRVHLKRFHQIDVIFK